MTHLPPPRLQRSPRPRRGPGSSHRLMVIGVVLTVIGLVGHQLALWWNSIPLSEGTGANIGAGVAALAALLVAVGGLVTLVVGGLLRARGGSDPRVGG